MEDRTAPGMLPTEARRQDTNELDAMTALEMVRAMHRADREALDAVEAVLPQVARVIEEAAKRMATEAGWNSEPRDGEARSWAGGRLIYAGAGTSGRLGVLDASECPPTFSTPPSMVVGLIAGGERALREAVEGAEDDRAAGVADMRALGVDHRDVVIGIAASGRTPWVLGAMDAAREAGALTVGLSCVPGSAVEAAGSTAGRSGELGAEGGAAPGARTGPTPRSELGAKPGAKLGAEPESELKAKTGTEPEAEMGREFGPEPGAGLGSDSDDAADEDRPWAITVDTGAEVLTGSTRLKAGTATKLLLNMISTGVMVQLGYVYGNLMVNVQPTNTKLQDRAVRIVGEICALGSEDAARALEQAGEVKTAVVMVRLGVSQAAAREELTAAGGSLRRVLEGARDRGALA